MLKNLALVVSSLIFGVLLIEIALRLLGWSFPLFARPDPEFGWSFRPGLSGWAQHENTVRVRINRHGYRGPDWLQRPEPGTFRIVVLGDSFTDSTNTEEEDSLTGKVEAHLANCPAVAGRRVEVLNLGVAGYGTAQHQLQLIHQVAALDPKLVLLAMYIGNDVADNSRAVAAATSKPFYIERPSGELALDLSFRESDEFRRTLASEWQRRLVNSSYLLQALKQVYVRRSIVPSPVKTQVLKATGVNVRYEPQYAAMFAPPSDDVWRSAWSVTEKLLLQMRTWSQNHGIEFRVATIPEPIQVLSGQALRDAVARSLGIADLDYPMTRIANFFAQNTIEHLSLLDRLRGHADSERVFPYGFFPDRPGLGHLNAVGNEVAGQSIATWLCATLSQSRR